jgi:hypothetical protein
MVPLAQKLLIHVKIFVLPKSAFVLEKPLVKPAGLTIPVEDDVRHFRYLIFLRGLSYIIYMSQIFLKPLTLMDLCEPDLIIAKFSLIVAREGLNF